MVHRDVRKVRILLQRLIASQATRQHRFRVDAESLPGKENKMILATGKILTRFYVYDDHKSYTFCTLEPALGWVRELIDIFDQDEKSISLFERKYDEFGNMISEAKIL